MEIEDMFDPLAEARKAFNMFDSDGSGSLNVRYCMEAYVLHGRPCCAL